MKNLHTECMGYRMGGGDEVYSGRTAAQVSRDGPPVSMVGLLVSSLTEDQGILEAAPAIVVRVENVYQQGNDYFSVDARADWSIDSMELSVVGAPDRRPTYRIVAFVSHESNASADARARMRSGHYVAYARYEDCWYELNDSRIVALSVPPSAFPYLVFLVRQDGRRLRGKQAVAGTSDTTAHGLLRKRAVAEVDAAGGGPAGRACKRPRRERTGEAVGRDQTGRDRTGEAAGRDQTSRDRTGEGVGRDQTGLDARTQRVWGTSSQGDNRDHSRSDAFNSLDNPFKRYRDTWNLRRTSAEVTTKTWADRAEPTLPQPCRLCPDAEFVSREDWQRHVDEVHGGLQRYSIGESPHENIFNFDILFIFSVEKQQPQHLSADRGSP